MLNLIGLILPPIIDLINKEFISNKTRFWIAFSICAVLGVILTYVQTGFIGFQTNVELVEAIAINITSVFGMSQISYKAAYEDSKIQEAVRGEAMSWK